jgi:hypothetical protein
MSRSSSGGLGDAVFSEAVPTGIRCIAAVSDAQERRSIVRELRSRASLVVVGETDNWEGCKRLLEQYVPEVLAIDSSLLPSSFVDEASPWPVVLVVGSSTFRGTLSVPKYEERSFRDALEGTIQTVFSKKANELRDLMCNYMRAFETQPLTSFTVMDSGREHTISSDEVSFITVDGNYAKLHTAAGQFRVRETLNSLANSLDRTRFVRIHRSIIVNVSFIDRVITDPNRASALILRDRTHLPIGPSFSIPAGLAD